MSSRTKLIGLQAYESDGGLDWFWCGSEWIEWRDWRLKTVSAEEVKNEMRQKFERAMESAFESAVGRDG